MATPHRKAFMWAFLILAAAHVFLMAAPRLYPFTDLPNHLAEATVARDLDNASSEFHDYYAVRNFPVANSFHLRFCRSGLFPSVEVANRFLHREYRMGWTL